MAAAVPFEPELEPSTPGEVLERLRAVEKVIAEAEAEKLALTALYAGMHATGDVVSEEEWLEGSEPVAGPGAPEVAEFCIPELAAVLGLSTDAGKAFLGETVELAHRLAPIYERVQDGTLEVWRARRIARATIDLSPAAAAYVAVKVAPIAHRVGPVTLDRLVIEARVRFDPEEAEALAAQAAESRHATVHLAGTTLAGVTEITAAVDLPDAVDIEHALRVGAAVQAEAGSTEPLDIRRAKVLGMLVRGELDLHTAGDQDDPARPGGRARPIHLNLHLTGDPSSPLARVEETNGMVLVGRLAAWCTEPARQLDVHPVVDLTDHHHVEAYEVPDRIKEQAAQRDLRCVFPHCTRPARRCDHDHVVPFDQGGKTCSCNIAPLCRRHHRLKTHTAWRYTVLEPGSYMWTSPHGYQFLRDDHGTSDVTPIPRARSDGCLLTVPIDPDPPDDA